MPTSFELDDVAWARKGIPSDDDIAIPEASLIPRASDGNCIVELGTVELIVPNEEVVSGTGHDSVAPSGSEGEVVVLDVIGRIRSRPPIDGHAPACQGCCRVGFKQTRILVIGLIKLTDEEEIREQASRDLVRKAKVESRGITIGELTILDFDESIPVRADAFDLLSPPMSETHLEEGLVGMQRRRAHINHCRVDEIPARSVDGTGRESMVGRVPLGHSSIQSQILYKNGIIVGNGSPAYQQETPISTIPLT